MSDMKITKGAILSALLFLTSLATMAQNIKATVTQTGQTNPLETAVLSPGTEGLLCSFDINGNLVITKGATKVAELPMKYGAAMDIESTTTETPSNRTVEFTPDGYATIYSAFQIDLSSASDENIKFYAAKLNNDKTKLLLNDDTKITKGIIPIKTALVVYKAGTAQGGTSINLPYTVATNGFTNINKNDLSGWLIAEPATLYNNNEKTAYTLDYQNSRSGFFQFIGDSGTGQAISGNTIPCRAFLPTTKQSGAKEAIPFSFSDDPTGISDIKIDSNSAEGPRYNLSGQRVNRNAKGIIIVGGKKYINI